MNRAYLGIGSNLGDKRQNIDTAIALLGEQEGIRVSKISSYYQTEPVGYLDQDWFINCAVEIETALAPHQLLAACQAIENTMKRERLIRFGPRNIDLDILLYEGYSSQNVALTIPHPRMTERSFVLVPLLEIAGNISLGSQTIEDWLANLRDQDAGKIIKLAL